MPNRNSEIKIEIVKKILRMALTNSSIMYTLTDKQKSRLNPIGMRFLPCWYEVTPGDQK